MTRSLVLVLLLTLLGCPDSHGADGGVGLDAADTTRVERVDTFVCPDADGDGFQSAACGGEDCDDADPGITPSFSECTDTGGARSCQAGAVAERPCPSDAPFCDARTGRCQASACGDGVLHEGEECDDGNADNDDVCSDTCRDLPCTGGTQCPESRASCSDRREDGNVYCMTPRETGEPFGGRCVADDDCSTGWCDIEQGRCTAACFTHEDCGPGGTVCLRRLWRLSRDSCGFMCRRPGDCPEGSECTLDFGVAEPRVGTFTYCVPTLGDEESGGRCTSDDHCATNYCHDVKCTSVCADDSDCEHETAWGPICFRPGFTAPDDWPVEGFGGCIPERSRE